MSGGAPREGLRRAIHFLTGVAIAVCGTLLPDRTMTIAFAVAGAILVAFELARRVSPGLQRAFLWLTAGATRPAEAGGITGGTVLLFGYMLTWWIFPATMATRAILVSAAADPAASFVGTRAAPRGRKTMAGSLAALAVAFLILVLTRIAWPAALGAAVTAALAERLPGRFTDNLTVPLATALVLSLLA